MALLEDALAAGLAGIMVGVTTALAVPQLFPAAATGLRPLAKAVIKGSFLVADVSQDLLAQVEMPWRTLVAEARAELAASTSTPAADASKQALKEVAKEVVQEGAVELLKEGVEENV